MIRGSTETHPFAPHSSRLAGRTSAAPSRNAPRRASAPTGPIGAFTDSPRIVTDHRKSSAKHQVATIAIGSGLPKRDSPTNGSLA